MNNTMDRVDSIESCLSENFMLAWMYYDMELHPVEQLWGYDGLATFCMGDI